MAASLLQSVRNVTAGFQESATVEQEQDANSALTDLDKGLRSLKIGVQCESIVRFPGLFEKYPFPILINSAFLRLSDVFRAGNNFIRWCILGVTQQSEKHLDKILNVDEFVRRIFSVIHSNDPVARAITLRTLGSIANIIPERKNVHHTIVVSLDSHDALEVEAAIFAAERFSSKSRTFAANICSKIAKMIEGIATPVDLKLHLIPVLQHMYHDTATAAKARAVCLALLSSYPAQRFVTLTLHTMSQLAAQSLVDIQAQVELLINHLDNDPRKMVKVISLQDLKLLARKASHLWKHQFVQSLYTFVLTTPFEVLKIGGLEVLTVLCKSVAFSLFLVEVCSPDSQMIEVCQLYSTHSNLTLASKAVEFFTHVVICYSKNKSTLQDSLSDMISGASTAISTMVILASRTVDTRGQAALQLCLHCAVEFSKSFPAISSLFVCSIIHQLEGTRVGNSVMLCQGLAAIGSENSDVLRQALPQLLQLLRNIMSSDQEPQQLEVYLCTVLFQAGNSDPVPEQVQGVILAWSQRASPWLAYKLARQAVRYGQYPIARHLFADLAKKVASEHFYFWTTGMYDVCCGESHLEDTGDSLVKFVKMLWGALDHYQKALAAFKAASTPTFPLRFQCEYVNVRAELMQVHAQLIHTCNTFRTCPPPAIITALAMTNGQEITRCGQIVHQLNKRLEEYEALGQKITDLYQGAFDADPQSHQNIQLLQQSCEVMKVAITSIVQTSKTRQSSLIGISHLLNTEDQAGGDRFTKAVHNVSKGLDNLLKCGNSALTHQHMEYLCSSAQSLITTQFSYPRYFFQVLQSTTVKLAVSPQQNANMEPVLVQSDTHLALKIEGVVQHGSHPGLFRTVHSVKITVGSIIQSKTGTNDDIKLPEPVNNTLSQTVEPHHDYFSVNLLLAFPVTGIHIVNIEAAIIDETGAIWKTGPKTTLTVKSFDSVQKRQQAAKSRSSFGQFPS